MKQDPIVNQFAQGINYMMAMNKSLNYTSVADKAGASVAAVSRLLRSPEAQNPTIDLMSSISGAFDMSITEVLEFSERISSAVSGGDSK